ncbi:hypothetical protein [Pseudoflavitalea rhizosphaerae]|uniref:hypothetical protein n=1 Tax=Pseudoflavitalea rhizosphaerae TaxID=1884793 RepID=UPI000F8ECFC3|nr:hypothetical protein [Pseudoflavitalea rhizosphaerae]
MKQLLATLVIIIICCSAIGQRKTTTVKSYFRKDGTFVRSHTRHYNAGSRTPNNRYINSSAKSTYSGRNSDDSDINASDLKVSFIGDTGGYMKIGGIKIIPTTLAVDTNGIAVLVAVLRYNDTTIVDICPLQRSIVDYDYEKTATSLFFKIQKDKIQPNQIIELVSKYEFYLKGDYLTKSAYLGIGKVDLPKYMSLRLEAVLLK